MISMEDTMISTEDTVDTMISTEDTIAWDTTEDMVEDIVDSTVMNLVGIGNTVMNLMGIGNDIGRAIINFFRNIIIIIQSAQPT